MRDRFQYHLMYKEDEKLKKSVRALKSLTKSENPIRTLIAFTIQ
jgi:hypothetical protein